jgi:hypothetical protein
MLMFKFRLMLTLLINKLLPEVALDFGDKYLVWLIFSSDG